jgi:hypothetical protein
MNGEPMKTAALNIALALCAVSFSAAAQASFQEPLGTLGARQKETRALAVKGDYQAMRNIAYSYVAPAKGEAGSKVAGCAWYLLIPAVHKAKFDMGDTGNISTYCGKLSATELDSAYDYAFRSLAGSR